MFMKNIINKSKPIWPINIKYLSTSNSHWEHHRCKLLVVGGGTGGCAIASKFSKDLKKGELIVVEPSDDHYYQPMFTLIGGGIKKLEDSRRNTQDILPKSVKWIKDKVTEFDPKINSVTLSNGDIINYNFMLIAIGLQLDYDKIPGLVEALSIPKSGVCSNYSPKYVNRTYETLQQFEFGNAIFTYPNSPAKCPGAPQKICYIAEDYLRKNGKRNKAQITYNTSLPVIFGVKKYADALWKIVKKRDINVNLRTNLIEIKPKEKIAIFENLDKPEIKTTMEYSMLHVTPPMSTPIVLRKSKDLVTVDTGFVEVNKDTLQHVRFPNVFAIGDCSSSPNSKTAASISVQSKVVYTNLKAVMAGQKLTGTYDGYASCPLVTGYGKCIMAEFDYNLQPLETFPLSQDKEMWIMYLLKKDFMPPLYWHFLLKGYWNGPGLVRKLMHLGMSK